MQPLLDVHQLSKSYGSLWACDRISFDLHRGQVLGIVGKTSSGKSTLLRAIAGHIAVEYGSMHYTSSSGHVLDLAQLPASKHRWLMRTEWGFAQQNPGDGLLMNASAGANISERLLNIGMRHHGKLREVAAYWLGQVEIDPVWIDVPPATFSKGMQQQLQLARVLATDPRLVLLDEPTEGLDRSIQIRLLNMLRSLVRNSQLSIILATHDIHAVRLLAHRLLVMHQGQVVEAGPTEQVLTNPQHPYTRQWVNTTLMAPVAGADMRWVV